MQGRRRLLACVAGISLIVLFGAEAGYVERYPLAGWWQSRQVATAQTDREARRWLDRLTAEPGRAAKLRVALKRWGTGQPRYDYWLMSYFTGCPAEARHPWQAAILAELNDRPDLIYLYNYMYLFWAGRAPQTFYLPADLGALNEFATRMAATSDDDWTCIAAVEAVCGLGGRADLLKGLTRANWREHYARFRSWFQEHEPYLIFDAHLGHYILDVMALDRKQPPPERVRRVAAPRLPHPDWTGPLPDVAE